MILVVDASVALRAASFRGGFDRLGDHQLLAPPLMWSETHSSLHEQVWRGVVSMEHAESARDRLDVAPVARRTPRGLLREAWGIAEELGVAKTYDAEYLALARIEGGKVVTVDARLRRGADHLDLVVLPTEL